MSNQSSYFSISRISGILIGVLGILGMFLVAKITYGYGQSFDNSSQLPILFIEIGIIIITILIILLSLFVLWFRAKKKAKKLDQKLWTSVSKKQRSNILISVIAFLVILILIANKGYYSLITPFTLLFYGLVLLILSRFNSKSLIPLGLSEITLAILAYFIYDNEIIFLTIGVGIFPIIYGLLTFSKIKKATEN